MWSTATTLGSCIYSGASTIVSVGNLFNSNSSAKPLSEEKTARSLECEPLAIGLKISALAYLPFGSKISWPKPGSGDYLVEIQPFSKTLAVLRTVSCEGGREDLPYLVEVVKAILKIAPPKPYSTEELEAKKKGEFKKKPKASPSTSPTRSFCLEEEKEIKLEEIEKEQVRQYWLHLLQGITALMQTYLYETKTWFIEGPPPEKLFFKKVKGTNEGEEEESKSLSIKSKKVVSWMNKLCQYRSERSQKGAKALYECVWRIKRALYYGAKTTHLDGIRIKLKENYTYKTFINMNEMIAELKKAKENSNQQDSSEYYLSSLQAINGFCENRVKDYIRFRKEAIQN